MAETSTVGDLVAEFLQACGVDCAFGVASVHNLPMLDAIGRRNAVRFVMARGEAGGGHMADSYARVRGGLGALITSTGPGAANAAGALVEARFAGTPLLHIAGQTATANLGRGQGTVHDVPDQLGMLRSVSKAAYRVRAPGAALGVLTRAAVEALTPPCGPVSVEIPVDVQRGALAHAPALDGFALPVPPPMPPDAKALDAAAAMLRAARRPLLWLGAGARHAGEAAARLAGLGVPVITSWHGRGVLPEDHPMCIGALGNLPEVEAFYPSVDLMVVAGSRLRGHETRDMTLGLPARRVQIDVDPAANGRTYDCELFVCGDSALALAGLAERVEGKLDIAPGYAGEIADLKARATEGQLAALGPYRSFPGVLRNAMPRDALWVRDVTISNSTWGNRVMPVYGPRDSVYPVSAAIGPGLPLAIGAAIAAPGRKVVCLTGDGGFFLSLAELWTAVQEQADLAIVVMNDHGYGVITHIQDKMYGGRHFYTDLAGPDFAKLADLAGIPHHRVDTASALGPAVEAALAAAGPALVEVDVAAVGPIPPYFAPPPYAQTKPS